MPLEELLSDGFAAERACLINPAAAAPKPVSPGTPDGNYGSCELVGVAAVGDDGGTLDDAPDYG